HDGKVESFRAFWLRFNKRVGSNPELDGQEDKKHQYLCAAVADCDVNMIAGKEWEQAVDYLLKKYRSPAAIREYLSKKMEKIRMRSERDLNGLKELKEAAAMAFAVANE